MASRKGREGRDGGNALSEAGSTDGERIEKKAKGPSYSSTEIHYFYFWKFVLH